MPPSSSTKTVEISVITGHEAGPQRHLKAEQAAPTSPSDDTRSEGGMVNEMITRDVHMVLASITGDLLTDLNNSGTLLFHNISQSLQQKNSGTNSEDARRCSKMLEII